MENDTVTISRQSLEQLLKMHIDATQLLEQIPQLQDEGRLSEASQHIGAELEARTELLQEIENKDFTITEIIDKMTNRHTTQETTLEDLEEEFFG